LSKPEARDLAEVLARKAGDDAKAMQLLAPNPEISDEIIGFHAQQAIEKWLKAVMAVGGLDGGPCPGAGLDHFWRTVPRSA